MKITRLAFIVLLTLIAIHLFGQQGNGLYVHSLKGSVRHCQYTMHEWSQPAIKQSVTRLDSIEIAKNSEIVLIDGVSGHVYRCTEPMRDNIMHCIQITRKQANNLLEALSRQLVANAMGKNRASKVTVAGVTTRVEIPDNIHDSIACLAIAAAQQSHLTDYTSALPKWSIVEQDGLTHFVITNDTQETYCVNMLAYNRNTKEVSLCIVPSPDTDPHALVLPKGETMDLSMFPFIPDPACNYILFATKTIYSPAAVQPILRYPSELNCK